MGASRMKGRKQIRLGNPRLEGLARALFLLELDGECWVWPGSVDGSGYAGIRLRGDRSEVKVHRLLYEELVAPIPAGLTIDHLCKNTRCANPAHLEPVTLQENIRRGIKTQQTHCKRGHVLAGENLYTTTSRRNCRLCQRERDRLRRAA